MLLYSTDCLKRNSKMKNKEQHTFPFIERLLDGAEVEWKPLGEVTKYEQPTTYLVKSANYDNAFTIPVLTAGKTFILGYTNETTGIYKASKSPVIIFDDFTTANKWVNFDFKVKSSAMKMVTSKDESKVLLRYIYHWLNTLPSEFTESDHKRQWISNFCYKKIPIPCPNNTKRSLAIQHRIVDILDKFTELEAELEAELEGRKRQYEYYRNQLLSFELSKKGNKTQNNVTWLTIGEIFEMRNGYTPSKSNALFWNNGSIPWYRMEDIRNNGRFLEDSIQHITPQAIKGKGLFDAGSIIMATTATIGEHALLLTDALANQQFTNFKVRKSIKDKLTTKFIYYYFFIIDEWCKQNVNVSSFPSVSIDRLKLQPFPIPPLSEQQRIVSILDKFDTLTTSISEGLPKEIELRRKQYEFYRDRLLSFA